MNLVTLNRSALIFSRFMHLHRARQFSFQSPNETQVQSGIFHTISESTPVEYLQKLLVTVHDTTGLPWWATIACTTIFLRSSVTVPLAIYQNYILAKVTIARLELSELAKELKTEVGIAIKMYKWDEPTAKRHFKRSLKKQWNLLVVRDNCHPVKATLLIWFQIPLWVCFSVALRNLAYKLPPTLNAEIIFNELSIGGFGWISNLTQIDPLFILPVTFGLVNLAIIEIQSVSRTLPPSKFQKYVLYFFRGFTVFMIPVAAYVPSCITLYWTTSSVFGLMQNLTLMSPRLKRFCRIPKSSLDLEKPYRHIVSGIGRKYKFLKIS